MGTTASASGPAQPSRPRPKHMPDAAVNGCDVLLTRARRTQLPAAVAERRVHRRGATRRPGAGSTSRPTVDPDERARRARRHDRAEQGRRLLARLGDHDLRARPEHRRRRGSRRRPNIGLSLARERADRHPRHGARTRACRTSPSSTRRRRTPPSSSCSIHPAVALTEGHRYAVVLRHLYDANGIAIAPLADDAGGARRHAAAGATRARTSAASSTTTSRSVLGTTHPLPGVGLHGREREEPRRTGAHRCAPWRTTGSRTHHARHERQPTSRRRTPSRRSPTPTACATCTARSRSRCSSPTPPRSRGSSPTRRATRRSTARKTWTANFICVLPSTVQSAGPATPTLYGHGLLGSASEVEGGSFSAGLAHDLMGCATDWVGMSGSDIPNVGRNLQDMSTFDTQVDHMLQGFVNFQFLGRLLNSTSGFVTNAAFRAGGQPLFKTHDAHFMGYSQGGIMGGAVSALSTEWTPRDPRRPRHGLRRPAAQPFRRLERVRRASTPSRTPTRSTSRSCCSSRSCSGTAARTRATPSTSRRTPTPASPAKQIFIIENYGDHQVANAAAEMLARTIGAENHQPAFNPSFFGAAPRLNVPVTPQWGLAKLDQTKPAPGRARAVGLRHADAADRQPRARTAPRTARTRTASVAATRCCSTRSPRSYARASSRTNAARSPARARRRDTGEVRTVPEPSPARIAPTCRCDALRSRLAVAAVEDQGHGEPSLSVVVVVYDMARELPRTLRSLSPRVPAGHRRRRLRGHRRRQRLARAARRGVLAAFPGRLRRCALDDASPSPVQRREPWARARARATSSD